jgi:hypothetical protein
MAAVSDSGAAHRCRRGAVTATSVVLSRVGAGHHRNVEWRLLLLTAPLADIVVRDPRAWKSSDAAEQYVRDLLIRYDDAFENHWISDRTQRGDYLTLMQATIPGQFGKNHGIDVIGLDVWGKLWLIEVSRGTQRGAARFKGGGKPVKYAGSELQMSLKWRSTAAERFLAETTGAPAMLRYLFDDAGSDAQAVAKFRMMLPNHRKAVIIPVGAHFDAIGTDVDFNTDVYTCRFPSRLFYQ